MSSALMRQRQRLGQVLVDPELAGQRPGDLCDLQRMGQPGPVVIALVEDEDLGLVLEAAERGGMDHPVAVAPEWAPGPAWRLRDQPAAAAIGVAGIRRAGGSHSDRHCILVLIHLILWSDALNYD